VGPGHQNPPDLEKSFEKAAVLSYFDGKLKSLSTENIKVKNYFFI
jgi:hypothetical protein